MKKYLLLITLVVAGSYSYGQDLNTIKNMIILKQYEKVKPEIDSYLSNEKNAAKGEGWYYKAFVYNSLGRVEAKPVSECKALFQTSFDALKKYTELDPQKKLTEEEQNSTVYNIYYGFYDLGIKTYNDKNYDESFNMFKKTLEVHDYIYSNNLGGPNNMRLSAHDTDVVWNLAVLANELKRKDDALIYYQKIADMALSDEKYITAYDELVLKYKREKNEALFSKYVALAKKYYPADKAYWESQEIDFVTKDLEGEALINAYEKLTVSHPDNFYVFYNYGVELDGFIKTPEAKGKDMAALRNRIEELFKKAISINSTIEANLQLANFYYSNALDAQEQAARIKGTKPTEVALKKELTTKAKESINKCIPYAEEAVKLLGALKEYKYSDKANYKLAYEFLSNAAKQNGDAAKAAEYDKKREEVDKL